MSTNPLPLTLERIERELCAALPRHVARRRRLKVRLAAVFTIALVVGGGVAAGANRLLASVDAPRIAHSIDSELAASANVHALAGLPLAVVCPAPRGQGMRCRAAASTSAIADTENAFVRVDHGGLDRLPVGAPVYATGELSCRPTASEGTTICSTITAERQPLRGADQTVVAGYQPLEVHLVGGRGFISPPEVAVTPLERAP